MMNDDKIKFLYLTLLYLLFPVCFFIYQSDWYFNYGLKGSTSRVLLHCSLHGLLVFWCITWVCCVLYILNVVDVRPFNLPLNRFPA